MLICFLFNLVNQSGETAKRKQYMKNPVKFF